MNSPSWQSDAAWLEQLGERLARARLGRDQTQAGLAEQAGVSKRTLERLEAGHSVQLSSLLRVLRALELLSRLDALIPPAAPSPMQELKHQGKQRQRASSDREEGEAAEAETWRWGDET